MAKCDCIQLTELEDYLQYVRLQRELQIRLHKKLERSKVELQEMKELSSVAIRIKAIQDKHRFKTDKEMMAQVRKLAK